MKSSEFKLLVMPFSSRLYRLAYRLMGHREEAEDIVQEVYLKLWGMRNELHAYASIEALAVRITRNMCLDLLRRRKTSIDAVKSGELQETGRPETPSEELEKAENSRIIHALIDELPEPQRSLVHLRHLEEKEYEEIAELVHMNVNAIRVSISRARKQMRQIMMKKYATWKA